MMRTFGYAGKPAHQLGVSRYFCAFFAFQDWCDWQLGFSVCLRGPNVELHVPMGFFKAGWCRVNLVEDEDDGSWVNVG